MTSRRSRSRFVVEEGISHDPLSRANQEWIERHYESPTTLHDDEVPVDFWRLVAEHIAGIVRKTISPDLRTSRVTAYVFAQSMVKNKVNGMSPLRAQFDLHDLLLVTDPDGHVDPNTMRCFREAVYVVIQNHYLDRKVG